MFAAIAYLFLSSFLQSHSSDYLTGGKVYFDDSKSTFIENKNSRPYDIGLKYLEQVSNVRNNIDLSPVGTPEAVLANPIYSTYISDFQGVTQEALSVLKNDSSFIRSLFHLGDISEYQNLFVDSLFLAFDSNDLSKQQIILVPKLSGKEQDGTAIFKLLHGQRQISSVALDFSNLKKVVFDIPLDLKGEFTIQLEGDNVYYDNEFFFHIGERVKPTVSIISKKRDLYLNGVFGNKDLFDLYLLDPRSIDYQLIKQSDVVIIRSLDNLPSGFISQLQEKLVLAFPDKNEHSLAVWDGISNSLPLEESVYSILEIDYSHPLFSGVFVKKDKDAEMPFGTPIFDLQGDYEVLISFRDKKPYLIKLINSDTYLFNSALESDLSNIVSHAIFLPLMYQLAFSSREYNQPIFAYPGEVLNLEVENQEFPPRIVSTGLEVIPEFNPSKSGLTIRIPDLEPGFYKVKHENDSIVLAINSPREESIMEGLSKEELSVFFNNTKHIKVLNAASDKYANVSESGLWEYALFLIIVLVLSETLLHRFLR